MINLLGKTPKILVIGDLMVDYYLWGSSDRISPEAPVPVVSINNESRVLGGAGNVINNLKALNAKVDVMSVIGECGVSTELKSLLNEIEIDAQYLITEPKRISSKKTRIIAAQQQVVRYDQENSTEITKTSQKTEIRKKPDFLCIDADGHIDVIELKDSKKDLLREALYRKNYVPSRELSSSIVQIEHYIHQLSKKSERNEESLNEEHTKRLKQIGIEKIKVVNHKGVLIIGRDCNPEQKIEPFLTFGRPLEDLGPLLDRKIFYENMIIDPIKEASGVLVEGSIGD